MIRQRLQPDGIGQAEDRRRGADADGEREHRHRREAGARRRRRAAYFKSVHVPRKLIDAPPCAPSGHAAMLKGQRPDGMHGLPAHPAPRRAQAGRGKNLTASSSRSSMSASASPGGASRRSSHRATKARACRLPRGLRPPSRHHPLQHAGRRRERPHAGRRQTKALARASARARAAARPPARGAAIPPRAAPASHTPRRSRPGGPCGLRSPAARASRTPRQPDRHGQEHAHLELAEPIAFGHIFYKLVV